MSKTKPNENWSYWQKCPPDILLLIFKHLDMKSLFNSMCVNGHWQDIVEYYCDHFDTWRMIIDGATNHTTSIFRDKSNLSSKCIVQSALKWYNVKNRALHLHHQYDFEGVRDICIYKDNLIVVANDGVKYYNIDSFKLIKTEDSSSVKCIETSSFIIKSTPLEAYLIGDNTLTVINKLHHKGCNCQQPYKIVFFDVTLWRVYNRFCYIMNKENVLRRYRVDKCKWYIEIMAYYEVSHDFICGMNICHKGVYLLMKNAKVYHIDYRGYRKEVYQLDISIHNPNTKPYMFNTYSAICVESEKHYTFVREFHARRAGEQTIVACPGLTCATEHGHILLLGYEDGKIQIFRTVNLLKRIDIPELQFYLCSYTKTRKNKIIAIDVYEDQDCHHVFAATESNVYEFLICDN